MSDREMTDVILATHNESAQARLIGVSRGTLQRWRKNPERIPLWALRRLAGLKGYKVYITSTTHTYS